MKPLSQPKPQPTPTEINSRQARTKLRADADAILRDMAFVLKMTQRVREEIATEQESGTFAMA